MDEVARLVAKAAHYRRLARGILDDQFRAALEQLSHSYEREAEEIDKQIAATRQYQNALLTRAWPARDMGTR